jgi:hypothetical protein
LFNYEIKLEKEFWKIFDKPYDERLEDELLNMDKKEIKIHNKRFAMVGKQK